MYKIIETRIFNCWLNSLKDLRVKMAISARIRRAENGNFGDHKSVGDGVYEMRIDKGQGYRVYYAQKGEITYLLICGGDKSSQQRDIEQAKILWRHLKQQGDNDEYKN